MSLHIHKSKSGVVAITDMGDQHLLNTIRLFAAHGHKPTYAQFSDYLNEAMRRGVISAQDAIDYKNQHAKNEPVDWLDRIY